jgi:hypothetical protein
MTQLAPQGTVLCGAKCTVLHFARLMRSYRECDFRSLKLKEKEKKMSYTVSFDASIKIKKSEIRGLLNHIERGAIDKKMNHKNPNINNQETEKNINFYFDKNENGFSECTDITQIENALMERLKKVKKPLRKDAVIVRPLILQLDPEFYNDCEDEDNDSIEAMIEWAWETFGKENIVGGSLHLDEAAPHLHLLFTPVTEDGRLSQKDWFKSPSELAQMHNSLRTHMSDNGYDIEMKRKKTKKQVKRLTETEYRDYKELEKEALNIEYNNNILKSKSKRLSKLQASLNDREKDLDDRESDLNAREKSLMQQQLTIQAIHREALKKRSEALKAIEECEALADELKDERQKKRVQQLANRYNFPTNNEDGYDFYR